MSQLELNQPGLRITGTGISLFEPAPLEEGRKRGYFRDEATRALLGLNKGDCMQANGTYGAQELAEYPIDFALLRDGTYDQRFLPFVSKFRGTMRLIQVDLRLTNRQWKPSNRAIKNLWENLQLAVTEAEKAAQRTNLPLPDYAYSLVPRLRYQVVPDDPPFEYQFQIWFAPQAHFARWRRIERVAGLLDAYANACHRLLHPNRDDWPNGEPIGIDFNLENIDDKDKELALAYAFLKVPIQLPESWAIPANYSLQDARAALLSDGRGSATGRLSFPSISELPDTDHDAMEFSKVRPDYAEHRYNGDGSRLTKQQRKDHDDGESTDMAENEGSDIGSVGDAPFPADKIVEIKDEMLPAIEPAAQPVLSAGEPATSPAQPAGETIIQPLNNLLLALPAPSTPSRNPPLQLDTTLSLMPPPTSNPASASNSAPASAVSSASSANAPPQPRSGAYTHRGRTSRRQQRSSGYQRSSRPPPRPQADREAWDQYFEGQEARGVSYQNTDSSRSRETSSHALAPRPSISDLGSVRILPQFRVVEMQAQPVLLHDTASNQMVETAILSTDFSQSAVLQYALQQQQQSARRQNRSPSRERDRSPPRQPPGRDRSRGQRRDYQQRSPSPDYRQRSPSRSYRDRSPPRERYQSSRSYERPRNPRSARRPQENTEGTWGAGPSNFPA